MEKITENDLVEVRTLNLLQCKIIFEGKSKLLHYYFNMVMPKDAILGCYIGDLCIGTVVLRSTKSDPDDREMELSYTFILEEYRGHGYGIQSVAAACEYARSRGVHRVSARVIQGKEHRELLERSGFERDQVFRVIECDISALNERLWQEKKDSYLDRMACRLERDGFQVMSFADAGRADIDRIIHNESGFDPCLAPGIIIRGGAGCFLKDYSFVCMRNRKVAAITLIVRADPESLVFQLISVAEPFKNSGALVLPVMKSMERIFDYKYKRVSYCIFDTNVAMRKVSEKLFDNLSTKETKQQGYIYYTGV